MIQTKIIVWNKFSTLAVTALAHAAPAAAAAENLFVCPLMALKTGKGRN